MTIIEQKKIKIVKGGNSTHMKKQQCSYEDKNN